MGVSARQGQGLHSAKYTPWTTSVKGILTKIVFAWCRAACTNMSGPGGGVALLPGR